VLKRAYSRQSGLRVPEILKDDVVIG